MFSNKILLITGGTGTFGNAILRRFLEADIKEIRIFSRDEKKQDEMRNALRNPKVKFYLGNVRDYDSLLSVMRGVNMVFHAAALKQVPSCEFFPLEAIRTNTICDAKNMIVISTDKAVYPINAMGMSKALMEKLMIARCGPIGMRGRSSAAPATAMSWAPGGRSFPFSSVRSWRANP